MRTRRIGAYVGIDPTASSLHIGHLVPLMPLFWLYMHGYRAISLVGGSTAKIGDPTGRLKSRDPTSKTDMTMNIIKTQQQLKQLWQSVEDQARKRGYEKEWAWRRGVVNNNAWWNKQPMLEVLRRVGQFIRIGPMLGRDTVKRKMTEGDGVSFAEFSYPIMQGWDWFQLLDQRGVQMQIGGSDQFGNILSGIEVVKAARESDMNPHTRLPAESELDDPVGFTVPLLTDASGAKFGKSAGNAVWLDQYQTSVYDMYGYFVRRPDADIEKLFKLLTFLPLSEIQTIMAGHAAEPSKRTAQHRLAFEVTTFIHGQTEAERARDEHAMMYGRAIPPVPAASNGGMGAGATPEQYQAVQGHPTTIFNKPRIDMILPESLIRGKSIGRILYAAGLVSSASEGHRVASSQGAYVGGAPGRYQKIKEMNPDQISFTPVKLWFPQETQNYLIDGKLLILRKGKHNIRVIEMVSDEEYKASGQTYPGQPYTGMVRKLNEHLKAIKRGVAVPMEEIKKVTGRQAVPKYSQQTLVFPEDKGRQRKELESKLREELANLGEEDGDGNKSDDSSKW